MKKSVVTRIQWFRVLHTSSGVDEKHIERSAARVSHYLQYMGSLWGHSRKNFIHPIDVTATLSQ